MRDPRTGYFGPWVRVVDWAWTLEETSSRPRRRRRRRHPGGVMLENPPKSQNPFPSFFDACGRTRDDFCGILTARTSRFFFVRKKSRVFRHFPALGGLEPLGGSGTQNPKIQNPKNQNPPPPPKKNIYKYIPLYARKSIQPNTLAHACAHYHENSE